MAGRDVDGKTDDGARSTDAATVRLDEATVHFADLVATAAHAAARAAQAAAAAAAAGAAAVHAPPPARQDVAHKSQLKSPAEVLALRCRHRPTVIWQLVPS